MKVKIIERRSRYDFEDAINCFISNHKSENILNIQYAGAGVENGKYYSAMIVYKE